MEYDPSGQYNVYDLIVHRLADIPQANRDLGALVPVNFITHAGVLLTSACFADDTFDDLRAEKCISNLLAAHFRRFIIDLYWDPLLRQYGFCPASTDSGSQYQNSHSVLPTSTVLSSRSTSDVSLGRTNVQPTPVLDTLPARPSIISSTDVGLGVRQAASTVENVSNATSNTAQSSTTVALSSPIFTSPSRITPYQIGPYKCSTSLNLSFLASLVADYVENTSNTLSANLLFFQINLHAAISGNVPSDPARPLSGTELPSQSELVGKVLDAAAFRSIYQPSELSRQRESLNNSWYGVAPSEQPIAEYFITENLPGGDQSTSDGWPSEYFVELRRFNRVLLGWGSIDPQMAGYDFTGDSDVVFPPNHISTSAEVRANTAGRIESGCFYNAEESTVAQSNSSWAVSMTNTPSNLEPLDRLWFWAGNLTSCGITPILNVTLSNQSADSNVSPYVRFMQSTVWNWAPGEPRNASLAGASSSDDRSSPSQFRCALMETSAGSTTGNWRVEYCNLRYRVACRIANQPYLWRLSDDSVPFSAAEQACQVDSSFSVPRTALENTYLVQHILSLPDLSRSALSNDGFGVWLNFNSLDIEACWVTTGPNGTCPYFVDEDALRERAVLVPVIAALVVLLLTALTLFVKCNQNRRNSRKRIRGGDGWDYEGVPS